MQEALEYIGQKPIDILILKIYKGEAGTSYSTEIYEDDGNSMNYINKDEYCLLKIKCDYKESESIMEFSELQGNYKPSWKSITLIIHEKGEIIKEVTEKFSEEGMKITIK